MLLTEWTDFILFIHVSEKFFEKTATHRAFVSSYQTEQPFRRKNYALSVSDSAACREHTALHLRRTERRLDPLPCRKRQRRNHPAGHYASVTQTSHFLVLCFPLRHDKLTTSASSGAQHICFQRSRL